MNYAPSDLVMHSIVMTGSFEVKAAQPSSLLQNGLITTEDVLGLEYEAIFSDLVQLKLPWLHLQIEPQRIVANSTQVNPLGEPIRDFVFALVEGMEQRQLFRLGINVETHFSTEPSERWHGIGDALVPKDPLWTSILSNPGLQSITMRSDRDSDDEEYIQIRVEPSLRIKPGIYVAVNHHFENEGAKFEKDPDKLLTALLESWSQCQKFTKGTIDKIKASA